MALYLELLYGVSVLLTGHCVSLQVLHRAIHTVHPGCERLQSEDNVT